MPASYLGPEADGDNSLRKDWRGGPKRTESPSSYINITIINSTFLLLLIIRVYSNIITIHESADALFFFVH